MINKIIAYESGKLSDKETIALFQELINNGRAWTLQGHYGRTAAMLIETGRCVVKDEPDIPEKLRNELEEEKKCELNRYFCK